MKRILSILFFAIFTFAAIQAQTLDSLNTEEIVVQAESIDSERSKATFSVSDKTFFTVEGTITGMAGEVQFDPNDLANSYFNTSLAISTIDTKTPKRDAHLQEEEFFYAEHYPQMTFTSSSISSTSSGYSVSGTLTVRGVSKEIEFPFQYNESERKLEGKFKINRIEYGVGSTGASSYNNVVGHKVSISIKCFLL